MQRSTWDQWIFPLPLRVLPEPWEDLSSLLTRTAEGMGYSNPQWLLQPEEVSYTIEVNNLCFLRNAADYQHLQLLLSLDEETLFRCTYHRFTPLLQPPRVVFGNSAGEIRRPLLEHNTAIETFQPHSSTKVCPACLSEGIPYGRLYWGARSVVLCPQHRLFLIERCPQCDKPIPLLRPSITHCPRCRTGDYRVTKAVASQDPYLRSGQVLTLGHLGVDGAQEEQGGVASVLAGSPLLELPPKQYFLLLSAFRHTLPALFPDDPILRIAPELRSLLKQPIPSIRALSSLEWRVLAATVPFIFASWPEHFFAFLHALIRARGGEGRTLSERRDFGQFSSVWLYNMLQDPAFLFLRKAYETYLKTYYVGQSRLAPQDRLDITLADAKIELGISQGEIDLLINQGLLRVVRVQVSIDGKTSLARLERASVIALRREWDELGLLPLESVTKSVPGVSGQALRALGELEWLLPMRGPMIDGYPVQLYRADQVDQLVAALLRRVVKAPVPAGENITLLDALSFKGVDGTKLLSEALSGRLTLIDAIGGPLFERLLLPRAELHRLLEARKRKHEECGLLTLSEAAERLGVQEHVLLRWVRLCMLPVMPGGETKTRLLFDQGALEAFRCMYLPTPEAARLLGVSLASVHRYVRIGKLHPIFGQRVEGNPGLLFRREEIEVFRSVRQEKSTLRRPLRRERTRRRRTMCKKDIEAIPRSIPSGYLTVPQAGAVLGLSRQRIHQLIQREQLPCAASPVGRTRNKFLLLSDIEAFQRKRRGSGSVSQRIVTDKRKPSTRQQVRESPSEAGP